MDGSATVKHTVTYRDVFANGNWIRLWVGQTISQLGDFVAAIAFPLLVYEVSRSPIGLGLGFGVEMLPLVVVGPLAGVFADRWNRRTLLFIADLVRTGCALGMFLSTSLWQLYVLALLAAIMQSLFLATYSATIPQITQKQFTKSISLSYMGYNTMQVLGPMVAVGIIGLAHGPRLAFLFDALTFATGWVMTLTIYVGNVERKDSSRHFVSDLRQGLGFLWKNPAVRYLSSHNVVLTLASAASTLGTILYVKAALGLSPTASNQFYGLIGVVLAGSLAIVAWLLGLLEERISKRTLIFFAPPVTGLVYLLFLLHPGPFWLLPLFLLISVGNACSLLPRQVLMARMIPNELRGRIYSCFNALSSLTSLIAYGLFAALGLVLAPGVVLALAGVILLLGIPLCTLVLQGREVLATQGADSETVS